MAAAAQAGAAAGAKTAGPAANEAAAGASNGQAKPDAGARGKAGNDEEARWLPLLGLPCELAVDLPVPAFKVSDLLKLRAGSIIDAHWRVGHDVPLSLNGTLIGWSKIEVIANRLAVRLTELA